MRDRKPNIKSPLEFNEKLRDVMNGIYDLIELTKEHSLSPVSKNGVIRYSGNKTCFQASGQYERPSEFLQTLLDIIRVNYEPCVLGTFFLNSNMHFLYDAIPDFPFQLAYASITSQKNTKFEAFWTEDVIPHLIKQGYDMKKALVVFAVASTGNERYGLEFVEEITDVLGSGVSIDEAVCLLKASASEDEISPIKEVYSGYCLDSDLDAAIRLSLWIFIENKVETRTATRPANIRKLRLLKQSNKELRTDSHEAKARQD